MIKEYADELLDVLAHEHSIRTFTSRDPAFDKAKAYAVAAAVHAARVARGERPVGRKIGFTNQAAWAEHGLSEPIWGHVYDTTVTYAKEGQAELGLGRLVEPRIEPEIVLHFKSAAPVTRDEPAILECIDWIAHGFEIAQSPFPHWKFKVEDAIAAYGLHGALVVGERVPVSTIPDCAHKLRQFYIALARGGAVQARGAGANVLDSPLLAFAHLAEVLVRLPQFASVGAGEIVTTGTLTAALPVKSGETWRTRLDGIELPGLTVTFR